MADDDTRQISVRASGRVDVAPDRATFQTGVVTQARTAKDALAVNSSAMQNLVDGLKALGIKARDLQTSDFSINPQYRRNKNGPPEIEAFEVRNTLAILIRDTDRIGEIIDKSASLGANQFGGLRFVVSGEDEKLDAARANAMEAARRK
ncbi:MAG: SIMPL domain-containing protein, partial [Pseudomonadota bacterium]